MDRESKKRLKELEAEQEKLYGRIEEIKTEMAKIQASDVINYVGKLLCVIDPRKTWLGETYILVKSQEEPDNNGVFHVLGPAVTIQRDSVTGNLESAQFLRVEHGGAWISKTIKVKEVTKDEVIKITSQLGFDYWNDKL